MTLHDLVRKLFSDIPASPGDYYVNCPFCEEEVGKRDFKKRFGLNTLNGKGHCHRCEKKYGGATGGKAYWFRELCRVFSVNYPFTSEEDETQETIAPQVVEEKKKPVVLPKEFEPLWVRVNDKLAKKALKYITDRGVKRDQIVHHHIGFCAAGDYSHRIIFPVYGTNGKLKAFVGRDFTELSQIKYKNSEGAKSLYNLKKRKKSIALLVEGIFDVLAGERSLHNVDCIANLGKSLTLKQLKILAKYETVVIWPDFDRAGVEGAIKRAVALKRRKVSVFVILPPDDIVESYDLGKMRNFEIRELYAERVPYSDSAAALMRLRVAAIEPPKRKRKQQWNKDRQPAYNKV